MFLESLIFTNVDVTSTTELFELMNTRLSEAGYVKPSYGDALIKREAQYPTGLEVGLDNIAIPHVDSEHIEQNGIAVVRTTNPIKVHEMMSNKEIDVQIFFFLLIKDKEKQVDTLSHVMGMLADDGFVAALINADDAHALYSLLNK